MLIERFSIYARNHLKIKETSIIKYKNSFKIIENLLEKKGIDFSFENLSSLDSFRYIQAVINDNEDYIAMNLRRHNDLSAAFNNFEKFLLCGRELSADEFSAIFDFPMHYDKHSTDLDCLNQLIMNSIINMQVKDVQKNTCFIDNNHTSFISHDGRNFLECHYITPLYLQDRFSTNLNTYANIIAICPNCHRAIHLGNSFVRNEMLREVFERTSFRLKAIGVYLTLGEITDIYNDRLLRTLSNEK